MNESDAKAMVGGYAKAKLTDGRVHDAGRVIAWTDEPTFVIERPDGTRFSWRADLCEPSDEQDPSVIKYQAQRARDSRAHPPGVAEATAMWRAADAARSGLSPNPSRLGWGAIVEASTRWSDERTLWLANLATADALLGDLRERGGPYPTLVWSNENSTMCLLPDDLVEPVVKRSGYRMLADGWRGWRPSEDPTGEPKSLPRFDIPGGDE